MASLINSQGVRRKCWTGLRCKSKALPVFEGTERAKEDLDALFVIPADIEIDDLDELLNGCRFQIPKVEQFRSVFIGGNTFI